MSLVTMARDLEPRRDPSEWDGAPTDLPWDRPETGPSRLAEDRTRPKPGDWGDEHELIERCLRRDPNAWQALFQSYHPRLLLIIKLMLGHRSSPEQAEEIASAVWLALCAEGYSRLRRYESHVGRLLTYLASLARREIWRARRSERSRFLRECRAARNEATRDEVDRGLDLSDLLATLTRREREFCLNELLEPHDGRAGPTFTPANGWQLRCRVLKKFRAYFLREKPL